MLSPEDAERRESYTGVVQHENDDLSWIVLKAHTNNTAGEVRLRSSDPRERPYINFRYFNEGNDSEGKDLEALVEGVKFVRKLIAPLKRMGLIVEEELPGDNIQAN